MSKTQDSKEDDHVKNSEVCNSYNLEKGQRMPVAFGFCRGIRFLPFSSGAFEKFKEDAFSWPNETTHEIFMVGNFDYAQDGVKQNCVQSILYELSNF